jgi:hypothetical protein
MIDHPTRLRKQHVLGGIAVLGVLVALSLTAVGVARHSKSVQGPGRNVLQIVVALLLAYGVAGVWAWYQQRAEVIFALRAGTLTGALFGAVLVANHTVESYGHRRPFVLIILPVLLALALFGAAGSTAWEHTRSLGLAMTAGVWCAMVGMLILLCVVFSANLVFERNAELQMSEAFGASGLGDPGVFLVRNTLEAASEGLVRMPILALVLSLVGAVANTWMSKASRRTLLLAACLAPFVFAAGAAALWHADSLERAARPPFVMSGVVLAGLALGGAHPLWSSLHRVRGMTSHKAISSSSPRALQD